MKNILALYCLILAVSLVGAATPTIVDGTLTKGTPTSEVRVLELETWPTAADIASLDRGDVTEIHFTVAARSGDLEIFRNLAETLGWSILPASACNDSQDCAVAIKRVCDRSHAGVNSVTYMAPKDGKNGSCEGWCSTAPSMTHVVVVCGTKS